MNRTVVQFKTYTWQEWLTPITQQDVPNKKHIETRWAQTFPGAAEYAVPFFWGIVGIAYRKDLVKQPTISWKQLLDPAPEQKGKIVLVKDFRDLISMALKSLGFSVSSTDWPAQQAYVSGVHSTCGGARRPD